MSHNNIIKKGPNPEGILGSKNRPLDRPQPFPPSVQHVDIGDAVPKRQGVESDNPNGLSRSPIEPPAALNQHKSPYHHGGRGRPNQKHIIWQYLYTSQSTLTSKDISFHVGLTSKVVTSLISRMVKEGTVLCHSPQRHLGQRFPSVYWVVTQ